RRRLDRTRRGPEPRARLLEAVVAHDLGDALGAGHVLRDPVPVEELGATDLGGRRKTVAEVAVPGRSICGQCLAGGGDLLGRQPTDPHPSPYHPGRDVASYF